MGKDCIKEDYYPFGMQMPGRTSNAGTYRYGFSDKEFDNEIKGTANHYDYGNRMYDPRVGKFYSIDPYHKRYPFYSPYQYAGNSPIAAIDIDGLEPAGRVSNGGGEYMYKSMIDKGRYQTIVAGEQVDGTLYRVVDALKIDYWILEETKIDFYQDTWGGRSTAIRKEYYYFTKPPSTNAEDYNGGEWLHYDSENRIAMRQSSAVASGIGAGVFIGIAAPFAAPISGEAFSASLSTRGYSVFVDASTQYLANKLTGQSWSQSFEAINTTSLLVSAINPGNSLESLLKNNLISSSFSSTLNGYNGLGGGKSLGTVLFETTLGTVAGKIAGSINVNASVSLEKAQAVRQFFVNAGATGDYWLIKETNAQMAKLSSSIRRTEATTAVINNIINNKEK